MTDYTPAPDPTTSRWSFTDPVTSETYSFRANPNQAQKQAKLTVTAQSTTASDGAALLFEGEQELAVGSFSGTVVTEAQYLQFVSWFKKRRPILLTDDLGRQSYVVLTDFDPKRAWGVRSPYKMKYTMNYTILREVYV